MKVLHAWAAIEQGKTGNSLGISDPLAFSPNEVSEAAEFWTRLNGASIVFSIGCALENQGLSQISNLRRVSKVAAKGGIREPAAGFIRESLIGSLKIPNCSGCIKGGSPRGSVLHGDPPKAEREH